MRVHKLVVLGSSEGLTLLSRARTSRRFHRGRPAQIVVFQGRVFAGSQAWTAATSTRQRSTFGSIRPFSERESSKALS